MFKYIFILFGVVFIAFLIKSKIRIKFKSFFKRGIKLQGGKYGVYCYCGKQGSSKTMSVIKFLHDHSKNNEVIYCNMKSIDKDKIPYRYIEGLEGLLSLRSEHDIIIFFDEIFTEITKHQKISSDVMDFLSQMRKRRIILLTTCQEWRLLPLDFRLYVRFQVNCSMRTIPFFNAISIKKIIDGDNIKWSDEEQDFVGELVETTVWHCEKEIANCYDTYEQIGKYSNYTCAPESKQVELEKKDIDTKFWNDISLEDIVSDRADTTTSPMSELCQRWKGVVNEE